MGTPDLILTDLEPEHLRFVATMLDDPDTQRFTRFPTSPPPGWLEEWFDRYARGREDGSRAAFAAVGEDHTFLGLALAPHRDPVARELELGYVVAPAARGRGVGTALLHALTDWAFDQGAAERVTLVIDVRNAASAAMARRCGYTLEGVMRSVYVRAGERADAGLWSRLRVEHLAGGAQA